MIYVTERNINSYIGSRDTEMTLDEFVEFSQGDNAIEDGSIVFDCLIMEDHEIYDTLMDNFRDAGLMFKIFYIDKSEVPDFIPEDFLDVLMASHENINNSEYSGDTQNQNNLQSEEATVNNTTNTGLDYGIIDNLTMVAATQKIIDNKTARTYLFGSSKGGSGKTFTCIKCADRYAKMHPNQKIAVADFDVIDGQISITIHKRERSFAKFYQMYLGGNKDFESLYACRANNVNFPPNLDFYLASDFLINDNNFWKVVLTNLCKNYDALFLDTGIDYLGYGIITSLYKFADKIILTSSTSIRSIGSVVRQIDILNGNSDKPQFTEADKMKDKIHVVLTQCDPKSELKDTIRAMITNKADLIGTFGQINSSIEKAEYKGMWNIFDSDVKFNELLDKINA